MSKSWIGRRAAEHAQAVRRFAAFALAALAIAAALPAHAFQKTARADGGFEYFFAAPSLDIRSAGDLDLTGLSFIEGEAGGFRVGASFDLDWMGGENAWLASQGSTWSGVDTQPRAVSVAAGGALRFEALRLSLPGGSFSLTAGESVILGGTTTIEVGASGSVVIGSPGPAVPPAPTSGGAILVSGGSGSGATIDWVPTGGTSVPPAPAAAGILNWIVGNDPGYIYPPLTIGSRNVPITPGGGTLIFPSPIPEPTTAALMLAGLLGLAGVAARRAKAEA
jgi:hypothetical protein